MLREDPALLFYTTVGVKFLLLDHEVLNCIFGVFLKHGLTLDVDFFDSMQLENVVFYIVWEELLNNEILKHWVVNQSFDKCLLVLRYVLCGFGHFLKLVTVYQLEYILVGLPPHEVSHVSCVLPCSFEVYKHFTTGQLDQNVSDHVVEFNSDFKHFLLHLALDEVDFIFELLFFLWVLLKLSHFFVDLVLQ